MKTLKKIGDEYLSEGEADALKAWRKQQTADLRQQAVVARALATPLNALTAEDMDALAKGSLRALQSL